MTRTDHLLTILAEECAEVIQRATKALRFGLDEREPSQSMTNSDRIRYELIDLQAVVEMLVDEGVFSAPNYAPGIEEKRAKVEKFLHYSAECGTLDKP